MSASDIRAGAAYVELYTKNNALVRGLDGARKHIRGFAVGVMSAGAKIAGIAGMVQAPLQMMLSEFAETGDVLDKMSARTGISVESLSQLGFAAEQCGTNLTTVADATFRMTRRIANAATGTGPAVRALKELQLDAKELNRLSPEEQFMAVAGALASMENKTRAAQMGFEILGDNFKTIKPLIDQGADGIAALRQEADQLGLTFSTEDATSAAAYGDAWNRVSKTLKRARDHIGAALMPDMLKLAETVKKYVVIATSWLKNNRQIVASVARMIGIVAAVGTGIMLLGGIFFGLSLGIGAVVSIISMVGTVIGIAGSILATILTPIGLIAAAIIGLGAYFLYSTGTITKAVGWLKQLFDDLFADFTETWSGISDAIAAGDMKLAMRVLWSALKMEWQKGTHWLTEKWIAVKDVIVGTWTEATYNLAEIFTNGWALMRQTMTESIYTLQTLWLSFCHGMKQTWRDTYSTIAEGMVWAYGKASGKTDEEIAWMQNDVQRQKGVYQQRDDSKHSADMQDVQKTRDDSIAKIDNERQGALDILAEDRQKSHNSRRTAYERQLAESAKGLEEARNEWKAAMAEAREKRGANVDKPGLLNNLQEQFKNIGQGLGETKASLTTQGSFSAAAVRAFTGGTAIDRTADATERVADGMDDLNRKADEGGMAFN